MLHRTEGFPSVVLRLFLTYGPYQDENRFLPQIIKACLADDGACLQKAINTEIFVIFKISWRLSS